MLLKDLYESRQISAKKLVESREKLRDSKGEKNIQECKDKVEMSQIEFMYWNNVIIEEQEKIIKQNEEKIND